MSAATSRRVEGLLERGRELTERVLTERDDARSAAVAAAFALEQRLQEAVAGDKLRGLRDLAPLPSYGPLRAAAVAFVGARAGLALRQGVDTAVPTNGWAMLVIDQDGALLVARVAPGEVLEVRAATADDVLIEHMEPLSAAVAAALERHCAQAERSAGRYALARALAERLAEAARS